MPNVPSGTSSIATQTKLRVMDSALPKVCHAEKGSESSFLYIRGGGGYRA